MPEVWPTSSQNVAENDRTVLKCYIPRSQQFIQCMNACWFYVSKFTLNIIKVGLYVQAKKSCLREPERPFGDCGECDGDGNLKTMFCLITAALTSLTN